MKRLLNVATGVVMALSLTPAPARAAAETPTYNQDVGPILLSNCASCHRPNQIAPMPLLSYKDARPWARAIKAKVEAREMPPWFADPRFGEFSNDTSLSTDEIATISAWVDAGAPEGDGPAPVPPRFSEAGWSHPSGLDLDYIYEAPFEWQIDADGESPNFDLVTPLPLDHEMWVSATEVRPGNLAVTHHITTARLPGRTKPRVGHAATTLIQTRYRSSSSGVSESRTCSSTGEDPLASRVRIGPVSTCSWTTTRGSWRPRWWETRCALVRKGHSSSCLRRLCCGPLWAYSGPERARLVSAPRHTKTVLSTTID